MIRSLFHALRELRAANAARRWHVRLHGGAATSADHARHRAWLDASPANREAYAAVRRVTERLDETRPLFTGAEIDRLLGEIPPTRPDPATPFRRPAFAAAAIAAVAVSALGHFAYEAHHAVALETPLARTLEHRLPDGTTVALGAASRIVVAYGVFGRRVRLERGEAFFDVVHERRPFRVGAAATEVAVHGTRFEVRLDAAGRTRVGVADGVVAVVPADAPPARAVELRRGQAVEVASGGAVSAVERLDPAQVGAWKDGQLVYRDAPLSTVAADFSRYSARRFVVNDPAIGQLRVTGLFRTDDLDEAFRSLESVLPVRVVNAASDVYIVVPATPAPR